MQKSGTCGSEWIRVKTESEVVSKSNLKVTFVYGFLFWDLHQAHFFSIYIYFYIYLVNFYIAKYLYPVG